MPLSEIGSLTELMYGFQGIDTTIESNDRPFVIQMCQPYSDKSQTYQICLSLAIKCL